MSGVGVRNGQQTHTDQGVNDIGVQNGPKTHTEG